MEGLWAFVFLDVSSSVPRLKTIIPCDVRRMGGFCFRRMWWYSIGVWAYMGGGRRNSDWLGFTCISRLVVDYSIFLE